MSYHSWQQAKRKRISKLNKLLTYLDQKFGDLTSEEKDKIKEILNGTL